MNIIIYNTLYDDTIQQTKYRFDQDRLDTVPFSTLCNMT